MNRLLARLQSALRKLYPGFLPAMMSGVLLTSLVFLKVHQVEMSRFHLRFENNAAKKAEFIVGKLDESLLVVKSLRSFYDGSNTVEHDEFRVFSKSLLENRRELVGLTWIEAVPAAQRKAWETRTSLVQGRKVIITERNQDGLMVPTRSRPVYFPVTYLEPLPGNEEALGFDDASEPTRLEALQRAMDTDEAVVTGCIQLVMDHNRQSGFLILAPVYRKGMPVDTVEHRRQAIQGFAMGMFRCADVLRSSLFGSKVIGINIDWIDLTARSDSRVMYSLPSPLQARASWRTWWIRSAPQYRLIFPFAGHQWGLNLTASRSYLESEFPITHWMIIPSGLLLSLSLALYLGSQLSHKAHVERMVQLRTAELVHANRELEMEIAQRKQAEVTLQKYKDSLEDLVKKRTVELSKANQQLQDDAVGREKLLQELQQAMADVKTLSGLLPICASCKKVRDDKGYWTQIEHYIQSQTDAQFTHGICPDCVVKLYPEMPQE